MPASYNDIRATMAICLDDAERMARQGSLEPTSEDIRSIGISMFIECRRAGVEQTDRMRFISRVYDLVPKLNESATAMLLEECGYSAITEITTTEDMKVVYSNFMEHLAANSGATADDAA